MASNYNTARWQRLREKILLRDNYTCQISGVLLRGGRSDKTTTTLRPAVIDHIIPHRGDEQLFWDENNLWAVSADIHDSVCKSIEQTASTGAEIRRRKLSHRIVGLDGYRVQPPAHRAVEQAGGLRKLQAESPRNRLAPLIFTSPFHKMGKEC